MLGLNFALLHHDDVLLSSEPICLLAWHDSHYLFPQIKRIISICTKCDGFVTSSTSLPSEPVLISRAVLLYRHNQHELHGNRCFLS